MKKTLFVFPILLIFYSLFFIRFTYADIISRTSITPSVSASPSQSDLINQLKERIASRVAQLNLVEKRGIIGIVINVTNTQITLTDLQGNTRFVDVDELTKFSSPKNSDSFGISDITKGTTLGVLGLYNKESKRILARFVAVRTAPQNFHGTVSAIDKENYQITILTKDQKKLIIDYEVTTRNYSYTKDTDLVKSGFSKMTPNERIFVVGTPDIKNPSKILALRIIHFPEIQTNISVSVTLSLSPTASETSQSSSENGKKDEINLKSKTQKEKAQLKIQK